MAEDLQYNYPPMSLKIHTFIFSSGAFPDECSLNNESGKLIYESDYFDELEQTPIVTEEAVEHIVEANG